MQNIVHQYFKREFSDFTIIVQVNPVTYKGVELTVHKDGKIDKRKLNFDEDIFEDLEEDDFTASSALEFNLYLKGLA